MAKKKLDNNTSEKFIEAMLETIDEKGGLSGVNLRMVAKKVGCAHTNAYNYFDGYDGLIFAAYDKALDLYGLAVVEGLDEIKSAGTYFIRFIQNIIDFALKNPGFYRFIGSDDFPIQKLGPETIKKAIELKTFFLDAFYAVTGHVIDREESDVDANILMSYLDGELYNIINMRAFPDENVAERIIENTIRLIALFTQNKGNPISLLVDIDFYMKPLIPNYVNKIVSS